MTFTEAAVAVLRLVGKPLHYKEITDVAIERSLLSHVGKSPEVTMGARLAAQVKKTEKENPLKRVKPGVFALSEWSEEMIETGLSDRTPALERIAKNEPTSEDAPSEEDSQGAAATDEASGGAQSAAPLAAHRELDEDATPPDEEEQHRAELSAAASDMFESEDDDDQPIFGSTEEASDDDERSERSDGKRRRRRRRGRGRRDDEDNGAEESGDDMPSYTVSDAEPEEVLGAEDLPSDLESGEETDVVGFVKTIYDALSRYDRSKGPVAAQNIADSMRRKGRGDATLSGAAVIAAALADNLAAERRQMPPRFRVYGNKIALRSWSLDRKLQDKEQALSRAAQQLREAVLRSLSDELRKLPQRAVGELVLVLMEKMGVANLTTVRRPGSHGSELHLSGELTLGPATNTPLAILIRRDGKDIGRERVTELRGGMHHYKGAAVGWVISTGQVLSGAKEEAQAPGASPVTLTGRTELAELCLEHGVGVRIGSIELPSLDIDLFEGLSGR